MRKLLKGTKSIGDETVGPHNVNFSPVDKYWLGDFILKELPKTKLFHQLATDKEKYEVLDFTNFVSVLQNGFRPNLLLYIRSANFQKRKTRF